MVRAGVRAAPELAQLAIEETGFGVFEDKVVKNYVATEFLSDYLRGKPSVGVIEEDVERNIVRVAEPIGVVLAITPVTNPTSTVLYKAIVAAKTRNAVLFGPRRTPWAAASAASRSCARPPRPPAPPPGALQVIPDSAHEVTHYLFKHPEVDFIWVTGGPKIVALANAAGKPGLSVGPGNADLHPQDGGHRRRGRRHPHLEDLRRLGDLPGRADLHRRRRGVRRDGRGVPADGRAPADPEQGDALAEFAFGSGDKVNMAALGQQAPELAARAGFSVDPTTKILLAPLPSDIDELAEHPLLQEKLMPVLGLVRAQRRARNRGRRPRHRARWAGPHLGGLRPGRRRRRRLLAGGPHRSHPRQRADRGRRLGGVYNNLTPTFSLGCGTWGGSSTTENVNYHELLNIKTVSHRRTPRSGSGPVNTFFNAGALENLRDVVCETAVVITDADSEAQGVVDQVRSKLRTNHVQVFSEVVRSPTKS